MDELTINMPIDGHLHLREGSLLKRTVKDSSRYFASAVVMPNLITPITTASVMEQYREDIMSHIPKGNLFTPLMTLYLTDNITKEELTKAKAAGLFAVKLYPKAATTNSSYGITDLNKIEPILEHLSELDIPLLIHGELVDNNIDIFDREAKFIDMFLSKWLDNFPSLRITLEHISTKYACDFIKEGPNNLAASITVHHLMSNRNDMLAKGGIKPDLFCYPILKRNEDQEALVQAATSGNSKFYLGTDSAPHSSGNKYTSCGCAGIYTAHAALELYTQVFESNNSLDKFDNFASGNFANFHKIDRVDRQITLVRKPWELPKELEFGSNTLIPFKGGDTAQWQVIED